MTLRSPALVIALGVASLVACTHDWDRFEVREGESGGGAGGGGSSGTGVGGELLQSACEEICKADRDCPNLTEAPSCLQDCAARAQGCNMTDIDDLQGCGIAKRTLCDNFTFNSCAPACY